MSGKDSSHVTLAHVDPSIVSCWDKMVKQGEAISREEQEEERGQEEEVGKAPGLPSTHGGGKETSSKQVDGGARCFLPCSFYESHQ